MERALFARRLREASTAARDFARKYIDEPLPDPILFRVRLNSSYDGNPLLGDERLFPEDSGLERAEELKLCTEEVVMDELWRDGRVPEWVDVAVIGENGAATLLQLMCCGRFTADESLLYHLREGRAPFHVTGPALPIGYTDGQKFSIYDRTECWSLDDVGHLRSHAHKVWALELVGRCFDDDAVANLPDLPRMEILELRASSISTSVSSQLSRFPRLRIVRIHLARNQTFRVPRRGSVIPAIEVFDEDDPRWSR